MQRQFVVVLRLSFLRERIGYPYVFVKKPGRPRCKNTSEKVLRLFSSFLMYNI